jgi:hypothetical protein
MPTPAETQAAVDAAEKALADAEAANKAAITDAENNLPPDQILGEIVTLICSKLGNPPDIEALAKRYIAAVTPPPAPPPNPAPLPTP